MIPKIFCLVFYYLGDFFCRIEWHAAYQRCMSFSIFFEEKYNLGVWKQVDNITEDDNVNS